MLQNMYAQNVVKRSFTLRTTCTQRCVCVFEVSFAYLGKDENIVDSFVLLNDNEKAQFSKFTIPIKHERSELIDQLASELLDNVENPDLIIKKMVENPGLCAECIDQLMEIINDEIENLQTEQQKYTTIVDQQIPTMVPIVKNEDEKELQYREALIESQAEQSLKIKENKKLAAERANLQKKEERYWTLFSVNQEVLQKVADQNFRVAQRIEFLHSEQNRLKDPISHCFDIGYEEEFGTINGLRMGRIPNKSVEWDEINAALGLCALLVQLLAQKRKKVSFSNAKIIVNGSFSKIEIDDVNQYEL